jgi:hypothetical protein
MSKYIKGIILASIGIFASLVNAQNTNAVVGQVTQIEAKLDNQKADQCNIELTFPNGSKAAVVASKPEYIAKIEFSPEAEGPNEITWQGKFRSRGLRSVIGCDGSGKITVVGVPSNDIKLQRWRDVAAKASDKQKICISAGMKSLNEDLNLNSISGEINIDVNDNRVKNIRQKCENFADVVLAKNQGCNINGKSSTCDEIFVINTNGETRRLAEADLFNFIFKNDSIRKLSIENSDAKVAREKVEADEAKRIDAYKNSPQYKKDMANAKSIFLKLMNKPLAYDCNAGDDVDVYKAKNNELITREKFYTDKIKDPLNFTILSSTILDKDLISIESKAESSNNSIISVYKFSDKSLQIYNSNFIENGFYKQNKKEVPLQIVCEKNSKLAQVAEAELNGKSSVARVQLKREAQAAEERQARLQAQKQAEMQAQAGKAIKVSKGREWVEGWRKFVTYLSIQAVADEITISKVTMNRDRCRVSYAVTNRGATNFPVRAQFGDTVKVDLDSPPCNLIEVEITTNLGTTSYSFGN